MLSLARYLPIAFGMLFTACLSSSLAIASPNAFTIAPMANAVVTEFTRYESPIPVTSNAQGAITWRVLPFNTPSFGDWLQEFLCSLTDIEASINIFDVDPATGIVSLEAQKHRSGMSCNNIYWVYLVATDSLGREAEVKWQITITEDPSPVFTLQGINHQTIEEYDGYTSPRPYATGKVLGNISYTLKETHGKFSLDSSTGIVTLPASNSAFDDNGTNTYQLTLEATDSGDRINTITWNVTINPIPSGNEFTLSGPISRSISENVDYVSSTIRASGKHSPPIEYSLEGDDGHLFTVDDNGIVRLPRKDYENPEDSNRDNIYEVTVIATDANGYRSQALTWTVTITNAPPRVFTINYASDTIVEGLIYTSRPPTMSGNTPWHPAVYHIKNKDLCGENAIDDACLITINASTGEITLDAKVHAQPEDHDQNNLYTATIVLIDEEGAEAEALWNLRVTFNMMKDTDGDGVLDTIEMAEGTDPFDSLDYLATIDGIPDATTADADTDGISNLLESGGIDPYTDNNNDGIPNYLDAFDRGDGKAALCTLRQISNYPDNQGTLMNKAICDTLHGLDPIFDRDQDGIPNFRDTDSDGDGIPDVIEGGMYLASNTLGIAIDTDNDGIADFLDTDSDNDGIPDAVENHLFGRITNSDGIADVFHTSSGDTLSALFNGALKAQGFNEKRIEEAILNRQWMADFDNDRIPNYLDKDSDNDGIPDLLEATVDGTDLYADVLINLIDIDSDTSGIADVFEVQFTHGEDNDSDGIDDRYAPRTAGSDTIITGVDDSFVGHAKTATLRNTAISVDDLLSLAVTTKGLGNPDFINLDSDGDCISDALEAGSTKQLTSFGIDSAFASCFDVDGILTNRSCLTDTDGDGIANYRDLDSDNDGLMDVDEAHLTQRDLNRDGMCDDPNAAGALLTEATQLRYSSTSTVPDYLNLQSNGTDFDVELAETDYNLTHNYTSGQLNTTADADNDGIDAQVDNDEALFGMTPIDCADPSNSTHPACAAPVDCSMDPTHPDCEKPDYCYDPQYAHLPECQDPPTQCELDPGLPECGPPPPVNCFKDFSHPLCLDPSRNPQNGKIKTDERGYTSSAMLAMLLMVWFARRRVRV